MPSLGHGRWIVVLGVLTTAHAFLLSESAAQQEGTWLYNQAQFLLGTEDWLYDYTSKEYYANVSLQKFARSRGILQILMSVY